MQGSHLAIQKDHTIKILTCLLTGCWLIALSAVSETLILSTGDKIEGTIIQTNRSEYLLLTDYGTYEFPITSVKEIRNSPPIDVEKAGRLSNFRSIVFALSREPWVTNLAQIPATVIDKGDFKNIPYLSFRCNEDYEVNIYGDLKEPVAIEAGVYRKLLKDNQAKQNCLKFITALLNQADKEIVSSLNLGQDLKDRSGLSFEITPPDAEDAYLGWWISVYSKDKLNRSRASEKELGSISVSKTPIKAEVEDVPAWSADEMKLARRQPDTITLVNSSGDTISNAVVERVVDGAYLIWTKGVSGGMIKLSDLPESVRTQLGYDSSKANSVYAADEQKRKDIAQARILAGQQAVPDSQPADSDSYGYGGSSSAYTPSGGGRVYVRGYTKSNGTYVQSHTRSAPSRR